MVDAWVAGAESLVDERAAIGNKIGADYRVTSSPWRKVWHTMEAPEDDPGTVPDEGWSLEQTRAYIIGHEFPPHLWALPHHGVVYQTVPLTKAAYALKHDWAGYPETNHVHAIQTEVMGFARNGLRDPELCDWLGIRVLRPILQAGVPIDLTHLAPTDDDSASGVNGSVRFTSQQWYDFDGICGHQNVPRNSHWDPGRSDYARIARAASTTPQPIPPEEDDDMVIIRHTETRAAMSLASGKLVQITGETNVAKANDAGIPVWYVEPDEWNRYVKAYGPVVT